VIAEVAGPEDTSLSFKLKSTDEQEVKIKHTGSYEDYTARRLGLLKIPAPGNYQLELRGVKEGWQSIHLKSVRLTRID